MKDRNDSQTIDAFGARRKPGPKPSGKALTNADRQRKHRLKVKAELEELRALRDQIDRYAAQSSQGGDRKPQPPTRPIVGGPGEDHSVATLDLPSSR